MFSTTLRPLLSKKEPVPIVQKTELVSGPLRTATKISLPPGFDLRVFKPIANCYIKYTILAANVTIPAPK